MKKLLFGISLILVAIFITILDIGNELPGFLEFICLILPLIGLTFSVIGLIEKED